MNFQEFHKTFSEYPLISTKEIDMHFPDFDYKNLVNWQGKKYIQKIRNKWYAFPNKEIDEGYLFFVSNYIYQPSYISLEYALSYYGFIPEGVFRITAVSTIKTTKIQTPIGLFTYQNIKPALHFGYKLQPLGKFNYKIATPEKAILDFLYLHSELTSQDDMEGLRWNIYEINQILDVDLFRRYLSAFQSKALGKRAELFIQYIENIK